MSLQIKIHGATPKGGKPLCHTCKYAQIVRGQNCEERIVCQSGIFSSSSGLVTFKVAECHTYHPSNMPWLAEMENMAWRIEARRRGPTGFQKPEEGEMEVVITRPRKSGIPEVPEDPSQIGRGTSNF